MIINQQATYILYVITNINIKPRMENIGFGMMNIRIYPRKKSQIILVINYNLKEG